MIEAHPYIALSLGMIAAAILGVLAIGLGSMSKDADNQDGVEE